MLRYDSSCQSLLKPQKFVGADVVALNGLFSPPMCTVGILTPLFCISNIFLILFATVCDATIHRRCLHSMPKSCEEHHTSKRRKLTEVRLSYILLLFRSLHLILLR